MNVVFCDIDGVLNSLPYQLANENEDAFIDPTRLTLLKSLLDTAEAVMVLSSSWRKAWERGKEWDTVFLDAGIVIYDVTPVLGRRRDGIAAWLDAHPQVDRFVIFDDADVGWGDLEPHVIVTDPINTHGLEPQFTEKALHLLTAE